MWLKVASTNNNPKVICRYFLEKLEEVAGVWDISVVKYPLHVEVWPLVKF
jgi:hypothetical protein